MNRVLEFTVINYDFYRILQQMQPVGPTVQAVVSTTNSFWEAIILNRDKPHKKFVMDKMIRRIRIQNATKWTP